MAMEELIFESICCNYCGGHNTKLVYQKRGNHTDVTYNIVKCTKCGLLYVNPRMRYESLKKIHTEEDFAGDSEAEIEQDTNNNELQIRQIERVDKDLDEIAQYKTFIKGQKLLDIGSGTGLFLERARMKGYLVTGIEHSDVAYLHSKSKGLNVIKGDILNVDFPKESFNIITAFEFIAHCYDPTVFLNKVFYMLRRNGIFYYSTANVALREYREQGAGHCYIDPEEHIYYYTPRSMRNFLKKAGFNLLYRDKDRLILAILKKLKILNYPKQRPENKCQLLLSDIINTFYKIRGLRMPIGVKR
ncbi:MAG: class I SAM-dependent methyltransferase [bacterium]